MTNLEMLVGMRVLAEGEQVKWYVKPSGISESFLRKIIRLAKQKLTGGTK